MNRFFTMLALSAAVSTAFAAETIEVKTPADFAKGAKVSATDDGLLIAGNQRVFSAKTFKVDPAKKVTLSFDIRKSADTTGCMVYVGFQCLDEDKVMIMPQNVRCEWNSAGSLAENAVAGSKDIRINMPPRFKTKDWCIVFNDKNNCSGFDMNVFGWQKVSPVAADGTVGIKLNLVLEDDYPAGTPVHFHSMGPGLYSACSEKLPNNEWEKVTCTVSGMQTTATPDGKMNKWFKGTKYGQILILVVSRDNSSKIYFKNIKLIAE